MVFFLIHTLECFIISHKKKKNLLYQLLPYQSSLLENGSAKVPNDKVLFNLIHTSDPMATFATHMLRLQKLTKQNGAFLYFLNPINFISIHHSRSFPVFPLGLCFLQFVVTVVVSRHRTHTHQGGLRGWTLGSAQDILNICRTNDFTISPLPHQLTNGIFLQLSIASLILVVICFVLFRPCPKIKKKKKCIMQERENAEQERVRNQINRTRHY